MSTATDWLERKGMYIALLAAWVATLGSLYFSEIAGYIPCTLCWYQRILMYPLAGIIAIGLLRRDEGLPAYVLPFSVFGIGLSTYHYLLQKTDFINETVACQVGVPCSSFWINWGGFITIPFLAMTAFVMITVVAFIVWQAEPENEDEALDEEPTPWLAVGGAIGVVVALFLLLSLINGGTTTAATTSPTTMDQADHATATIDGGLLYQQACAACHGPNLEGVEGLGNTLAPSTFIDGQSDEELLTFIRAGRALDDPDNTSNLVMPASGGRPDLNDAEMLAIINHIRESGESVE